MNQTFRRVRVKVIKDDFELRREGITEGMEITGDREVINGEDKTSVWVETPHAHQAVLYIGETCREIH